MVRGIPLKRRDGTRLIFDILSLACEGSSKTKIVYSANLNFPLAERYLSFLVEKRLIEKRTGPDFKVYETTQRGKRLLALLEEVERELARVPSTNSYPARKAAASISGQDLPNRPILDAEPVPT